MSLILCKFYPDPDIAPHYTPGPTLSVASTQTPALSDHETQLAQAQRARIPPPRRAFDFLPDLMATTQEGFKLREDVKPLHITQPEGVSFSLRGAQLEWQNWRMHVGA
jgi:primary-amine oxidase